MQMEKKSAVHGRQRICPLFVAASRLKRQATFVKSEKSCVGLCCTDGSAKTVYISISNSAVSDATGVAGDGTMTGDARGVARIVSPRVMTCWRTVPSDPTSL